MVRRLAAEIHVITWLSNHPVMEGGEEKKGISPGGSGSPHFQGQRYANRIGGLCPRVIGPIGAAWAELDLIMLGLLAYASCC